MSHEHVAIVDPFDVRFRVRSIRAGVWLTLAICAAGLGYAAATFQSGAHRPLIGAAFLVAAVAGAAIGRLPAERIVRSRFCEAFFLSWSLLDLALIATIAALDGGPRSPLALIFFVPIVFAA